MKGKTFLLFNNIIVLIFISILSFSTSQISYIIPLYKIVITEDLNNFKIKESHNYCYNTKGVGIIFNNNYNISVMPKHIFNDIIKYYQLTYDFIDKFEISKNGYTQYLIFETSRPYETIHFILKDMGITFPLNQLFFTKEEEEDIVYFFKFLTKEDQENIIIGKDLIELMNVTFVDNNIVINNKDYISKIKEED